MINASWPQWRGPLRDGHCDQFAQPAAFPLKQIWETFSQGKPVGGIAGTEDRIYQADRDFLDQFDRFACYDASNGSLIWQQIVPGMGMLDYGNSSRATPLLRENQVLFQSAFGIIASYDAKVGTPLWQTNVISLYGSGRELVWGLCSSPLLANGQLIFNPGGKKSSLVALTPDSGNLVWQTPGQDYGYGSLVSAQINGQEVVIGHDKTTLGAWDARSGKRLWTIKPQEPEDFNVPTPIVQGSQIIVATENNGCRVYQWPGEGESEPRLLGQQQDLCPETTSPISTQDSVFGVANGTLYCLSLPELQIRWQFDDPCLSEHACLVTDGQHVGVFADGELLLFAADGKHREPLARQLLFEQRTPQYAHPAIMGNRLYISGGNLLRCYELWPEPAEE